MPLIVSFIIVALLAFVAGFFCAVAFFISFLKANIPWEEK